MNKRYSVLIIAFTLLIFLFIPFLSHAQEVVPDTLTISKAKVLNVVSERNQLVPGTDTTEQLQTISVQILDGAEKGKVLTLDNDYLQLQKGQIFFLKKTTSMDSGPIYAVADPYRLPVIVFFTLLFIVLTCIFGGWQGIRGLISLVGGFALIFYVLFPQIIAGASPVWLSLGVASLIIILGSYVTHGFNRTTSAAVVGMIVTILVTGLIGYFAVSWSHLTGFETEDAVYLNFNTAGKIDMRGLLFGGILIGLLGVLYDIAIGQAVSVEELKRAAPHSDSGHIYKRAVRIGKEHIGALVNTLAIAYVGVSLPLLLLYYTTASSFEVTINNSLFSTEIIRTLIGSIGLVLAVPITTFLSVLIIHPRKNEEGVHYHGHSH
jgi:uncharacterized membrane protein